MKNYVNSGEHFTHTAAAAITAGQMVVVGSLYGVAQETVAAGDDVVLVRRGVFELPKTSAQAWTVGAKIYWDAANSVCTTVSAGTVLLGVAAAVAANPSATGMVLLDGTIR